MHLLSDQLTDSENSKLTTAFCLFLSVLVFLLHRGGAGLPRALWHQPGRPQDWGLPEPPLRHLSKTMSADMCPGTATSTTEPQTGLWQMCPGTATSTTEPQTGLWQMWKAQSPSAPSEGRPPWQSLKGQPQPLGVQNSKCWGAPRSFPQHSEIQNGRHYINRGRKFFLRVMTSK
jgi:hypothetical protein